MFSRQTESAALHGATISLKFHILVSVFDLSHMSNLYYIHIVFSRREAYKTGRLEYMRLKNLCLHNEHSNPIWY